MSAKHSTSRRGKQGKQGMAMIEEHGHTTIKFKAFKKNVLGTTKEGIQILKPRGAPTSFTWQELRAAMPGLIEKANA